MSHFVFTDDRNICLQEEEKLVAELVADAKKQRKTKRRHDTAVTVPQKKRKVHMTHNISIKLVFAVRHGTGG